MSNGKQKSDGKNGEAASAQQPGINPAEPSSSPNTHGKLEDVFIVKSAEYPLERHECNTFLPPMLPEEFSRLKEDITINELKVPIVLCGGKVLDGWQRYQICRQLKIQPRFEEFTGKRPLLQCWSLNVSRRHLEKSQLAVLANEIMTRLVQEVTAAKGESMKAGDIFVTAAQADEAGDPENTAKKRTKRKRGRARSQVSEMVGVSEGYMQKAKDLKRAAAPDLYAHVLAGTLTFSQAFAELRRRKSLGNGADVAEAGSTEAKEKNPSVGLRIKGLVIKICNLLTATDQEKEAYDAVQPVVAWSVGYEKREQAIKEERAKDDPWMSHIESKYPVQKAV
jgi:hypothetical protein